MGNYCYFCGDRSNEFDTILHPLLRVFSGIYFCLEIPAFCHSLETSEEISIQCCPLCIKSLRDLHPASAASSLQSTIFYLQFLGKTFMAWLDKNVRAFFRPTFLTLFSQCSLERKNAGVFYVATP
jgi:hypothetical protein